MQVGMPAKLQQGFALPQERRTELRAPFRHACQPHQPGQQGERQGGHLMEPSAPQV